MRVNIQMPLDIHETCNEPMLALYIHMRHENEPMLALDAFRLQPMLANESVFPYILFIYNSYFHIFQFFDLVN